MQEQDLRLEIRKTLEKELFYERSVLSEQMMTSPDEFYKGLVEPWVNVVKGAFVDLKRIASEAITTLRLMFTLNQKKAAEIVARQKDRVAAFEKESDAIFSALGGDEKTTDLRMYSLLLNPGAYVAGKIAAATPDAVGGLIKVGKQIGLGDISIATAVGDEAEEDALIRRRDQDGPITKALRALEQIFLFAHATNSGNLLFENADTEKMSNEIMAGPLGKSILETRDSLFESSKELIAVINSIAAQNQFLVATVQAENIKNPSSSIKNMSTALQELSVIDPESAKVFGDLPRMIVDEAKSLSQNEEFKNSEIEKAPEGSEPDFETAALKAVLGKTFQETVGPYTEAVKENEELLLTLINGVFPEGTLTKELVKIVDQNVPGFTSAIQKAETVMHKKIIE